MKRIPLSVEYSSDNSLRIIAQFLLMLDEPHIFATISAFVDTGSPITLIGSLDLKRMRLSKIQLQKIGGRNKPVNIGGGKITTRIAEKTKLKFGNALEIEMPVEFPIEFEKESTQPSLLGVDFMLHTKSKLIFDPTKKEAYFEIED
jgi:hypothetical protein